MFRKIMIFSLIAVFFFVGANLALTEDSNGELNDNEEVVNEDEDIIEEEDEEELEEEAQDLEGRENRLGRMRETINGLLERIGEDAPQREALEMVLARAERIKERVRERMQEVQIKIEEARERRNLAQQNSRMEKIRERIGDMLKMNADGENGEEANSALERARKRAEEMQNRIRERMVR